MSLSRIRNRIEALERKFAVPLAVVRLRPLAEKVCDEWAAAKAADKPLPKTQSLIKRIADHGIQATTFGSLDRYFRECRDEGRFPSPRDIATVLFPHAAKKGRNLLHIRLGLRRPGWNHDDCRVCVNPLVAS